MAISPGLIPASNEETCLNFSEPREEAVRNTSYVSSAMSLCNNEGDEFCLFWKVGAILSECFAIKSAASSTGLGLRLDFELCGVGQFRALIADRREAPICVGEMTSLQVFPSGITSQPLPSL